MASYGGSVSSSMGGRTRAQILTAKLSAERKLQKTIALRNLAPAAYRDGSFVVATQYYVGGDARVNFQLKTWKGDHYVSKPISALEAQRLNTEYPLS